MRFKQQVALLAPIAFAALAVATPAHAASIIGVDALKEWNLIVLGDLNAGNHVQGRVFVKGNLSGQAGVYNQSGTVSSRGQPALTVVGNMTASNQTIEQRGGAAVGGNITQAFNLNGVQTVNVGGTAATRNLNGSTVNQNLGASYTLGLVTQANDLEVSLKQLSQDLSGLDATDAASVNLTNGNRRGNFSATGTTNVITLSGTSFNLLNELQFSNVGTTIVNVSGDNIVFGANFLGNSSGLASNVIWNFYEATTVRVDRGFYGTVLAPYAAATMNQNIDGTVVFGSLTQRGEVHLGTFNGTLPPPPAVTPPVVPVPEPAAWGLLIAGFAIIGAAIRRRRAARMLHA